MTVHSMNLYSEATVQKQRQVCKNTFVDNSTGLETVSAEIMLLPSHCEPSACNSVYCSQAGSKLKCWGLLLWGKPNLLASRALMATRLSSALLAKSPREESKEVRCLQCS